MVRTTRFSCQLHTCFFASLQHGRGQEKRGPNNYAKQQDVSSGLSLMWAGTCGTGQVTPPEACCDVFLGANSTDITGQEI